MMRTRIGAVAVSGVAVFAMAAVGLPDVPAAASPSGPRPADGEFEPASVRRQPVGGPLSRQGAAAVSERSAAGRVRVEELVERRTASTRTFQLADGSLETEMYAAPVSAVAKGGPGDPPVFEPGRDGYSATTAEHHVTVAGTSQQPVGISGEEGAISFALAGADDVSVEVDGAVAAYRQVLEGVDMVLTVEHGWLKEELVLASPEAPREFSFALTATDGLEAAVDDSGAVSFTSPEGEVAFELAAPFMEDTSQDGAVRSAAIDVELTPAAEGWQLNWRLDEGWLDDPTRVWPVTVDPTVTLTDASLDCTLSLAADPDSTCWWQEVKVGDHPSEGLQRGLLRFPDAELQAAIGEPARVRVAELKVMPQRWESGHVGGPLAVAVHEVETSWSHTEATWSSRWSGGPAWDTPGGDFDVETVDVHPDAGDPAGSGWDVFYVTAPVQRWLDGDADNHGVILKAVEENAGGHVAYAGRWAGDATVRPRLSITWEPLAGDYPAATQETFDLGDGSSASVDVVSGTWMERHTDLVIPGTAGHDLEVSRTYTDWPTALVGHFRANWSSRLNHRLLVYDAERAVSFQHPDGGYHVAFTRGGDGRWQPLQRLDADLDGDGVGLWTLSWHRTGETFTYQPSGALATVTDRNGNEITYHFNSQGQHSSVTDTQGRVTTVVYDSAGRVETITDPAGRQHHYHGFDGEPLWLRAYTDPAGGVREIERQYWLTGNGEERRTVLRDPSGRRVAVDTTDHGDGVVRTTAFLHVTDPLPDQPLTDALPTGPGWTFDYDLNARQTTVTDPRANTTTYAYDAKGQVSEVTDALGRQRATTYTATGDIATVTNAHGQGLTTHTYSSDGRHNVTGVAQSTGTGSAPGATLTSTLDYDDATHPYSPSRYTAPQGSVVNYGYDAAGNLNCLNQLAGPSDTCVNDGTDSPVAEQWHVDRHADGTVQRSIDPNGNATGYAWTYNSGGQLLDLDIDHPAPRADEQVSYDLIGRVTGHKDGNGQLTSYGYDILDRVVSVTFADNTQVTYSYDPAGRRTTMTDPGGTTSWDYDERARLVSETLPDATTLGYGYDDVGNLTSFADADGTVSYTYDAINRPASVTDPGSGAQTTTFAYDDDVDGTHDRKIISYPNGVSQSELVDQAGRVKQIEGTRGPTVLSAFAYAYEDASDPEATPLRAAVTDHAGHATAYDYDSLGRLSEAVTRDPSNTVVDHHAYGYDDAGNRTSWAHHGVTTAYTHNAASQMTVAGSRTLSYDGAGNQTGDSAGQQLSYNAAGQTTSARRDTASALESYTYAGDTQLQRTAINTTAVVNAAHGVVRVGAVGYSRTAEGTLVSLREGATRGYYLIDGLGSVAAVTDDAGQVTNRYRYDPYGATTPACPTNACLPNPWQYTGAHHDEATGLYKIGHRYYQPHHGRWTQPDPLGERVNPTHPSEANAYAYVGGDPVNYIDPTGTSHDPVGCAIAVAGAGATVGGALATGPGGWALAGVFLSGVGLGYACS